MATLLTFVALQLLDAATTLVFLSHGAAEANPLIGVLLRALHHPALALAMVKTAACALAVFAWKTRRIVFLHRVNVFYTACVAWNLLAIAAA